MVSHECICALELLPLDDVSLREGRCARLSIELKKVEPCTITALHVILGLELSES